jgi:alpha-L-fucosidase
MKRILLVIFLFAITTAFSQNLPLPSKYQLAWQELETTAFLHFTVNTFTGKEWGDGTESPSIFNPVDFDARKIVKVLKETGFKMAIITAKHHDGFCLWPSKYTGHSVKNSPWKNGKEDIVKEIANACKEYGIKFGFYLSPWDRNNPAYGTPAYNDYYKNQLRELLTNYGEVSEVWFDGAKGENAKDMEYDFKGFWKLVRQLQPGAVMFSDVGPGVRWVGNENGIAGETCWSMIDTLGMAPGKADSKYLNRGDKNGKDWIPPESDVSIRPGWFYHEEEDSKVKSPKTLVDLYYKSVGRNSLLLLNIPPNKRGLFSDADIKTLYEFRSILDETFKTNLAGGKISKSLTDKNLKTYVTLQKDKPYIMDLKKTISFDRISLQENIANGQRAEKVLLEYWDGKMWKKLSDCTTVGHKRLLKCDLVNTYKLRITILSSLQEVQLAEVGLYKASPRE